MSNVLFPTGLSIHQPNLTIELMDTGKAKVDQDGPANSNISGEFDTNYVHIFNINMNYKF